jgi:hypothetical protein
MFSSGSPLPLPVASKAADLPVSESVSPPFLTLPKVILSVIATILDDNYGRESVSTFVSSCRLFRASYQNHRIQRELLQILESCDLSDTIIDKLSAAEEILTINPDLVKTIRFSIPNDVVLDPEANSMEDYISEDDDGMDSTGTSDEEEFANASRYSESYHLHNVLLFTAVEMNYKYILELFLLCGLNPNMRDESGNRPLHMIADYYQTHNCFLDKEHQNSLLRIVELLVAHGADINAVNDEGDTFAHKLFSINFTAFNIEPQFVFDMLYALPKLGADLTLLNAQNSSPFILFLNNNTIAIISYLYKYQHVDAHELFHSCGFKELIDGIMRVQGGKPTLTLINEMCCEIPQLFIDPATGELSVVAFRKMAKTLMNEKQNYHATFENLVSRFAMTMFCKKLHADANERQMIIKYLVEHCPAILEKDITKILYGKHPLIKEDSLPEILLAILQAKSSERKSAVCGRIGSSLLQHISIYKRFVNAEFAYRQQMLALLFIFSDNESCWINENSFYGFREFLGDKISYNDLDMHDLIRNHSDIMQRSIDILKEFYQILCGKECLLFNKLEDQLQVVRLSCSLR